MKKTVENRVSGAILQEKLVVEIGGVTYEVAPPSTAVLIKVSAILAEVPSRKLDEDDVLGEVLRGAKDWSFVGRILAQMIIGAERPKNRIPLFQEKDSVKKLADKLLLAPPQELSDALKKLFKHHQVSFFFGLIDFLLEVGITTPTKKKETTAPGPS